MNPLRQLVELLFGIVTTPYSCLICYYKDKIAQSLRTQTQMENSVYESDILAFIDVARVAIDDTIPIQEQGFALHSSAGTKFDLCTSIVRRNAYIDKTARTHTKIKIRFFHSDRQIVVLQ